MGVTNDDSGATTRRAMLAGAGAAGVAITLAACGTDSGTGTTTGNGAGGAPAASSPPAGAPAGGDGGMAAAAIKTADIPVNGGKVFEAERVVVTQPTAGVFEAFSAVCTHQGCLVKKISNNVIHCPCHGSSFSAKDGSVKTGPATTGLTKKTVKVSGDTITIT